MVVFQKLFNYVLTATSKYKIDESHALGHSFDALLFARDIYTSEVLSNPTLCNYEHVIYTSAIVHDMCDKKYCPSVDVAIQEIADFLGDNTPLTSEDIIAVTAIINTMSYSHVKQCGFPDLGVYQDAYHVVREADLLCAYDFDRCILYKMYNGNGDFIEAYKDALQLFKSRILRHNADDLFVSRYSKSRAAQLIPPACRQMKRWADISALIERT